MIHIHNGDIVTVLAQRAGIPGEHMAFRESLISGPIIPGDDWIETRARSLAKGPEELLRTRTSLLEQELALDAAPSKGEIVLWFEHDLFCLLHLIYLLQRFGDAKMTLVWCPDPLGENDERGLHLLFESRTAVTPSMSKIAREVWRAYIAGDPTELMQWAERDTRDFPFLREGLLLHASRFPSTINGLDSIDNRALTQIASGVSDFTTLFNAMAPDMPRFGFGDSQLFEQLQAMAGGAVPLITLNGEPPKATFAMTPAGENVLSGAVDNLSVNDPDRWLGGVHLTKENLWRYDDRAGTLVRSR
jgi:hypothetical protein